MKFNKLIDLTFYTCATS